MSYFEAMFGLGDTLYTRPVVRKLIERDGPIHLMTAWPQLFADLQVKPVRPTTKLRTQAKNLARDLPYHPAPHHGTPVRISYDGAGSMLDRLLHSQGIYTDKVDFSGPPVTRVVQSRRPYIVVRPATVRNEWLAAARNPRPDYLCQAVEALRGEYDIISVADLQPGAEYAVEPLPYADERFHGGELQIESLLALVAGAAGVVGGVGWLFPAAVAYQVPMLLVYGGWGRFNSPQMIVDHRMDVSRIVQAVPDRFCMCNDRFHDCDREITQFAEYLKRFQALVRNGILEQAVA